MARSWMNNFLSMKRTRNRNRNKIETSIESLPHELLTEVLAQVASASLADLSNFKLSCRNFLQAANDDYVYQHASIEKFHIPWPVSNRAAYLFLKRCKKSGNPEALFRLGMYEYFSLGSTVSGYQLLKTAAEKKHPEATYVFSVILLCSAGGELMRRRGFELLSSLKGYGIRECRRKIRGIISCLWIRKIIVDEEDDYIAETCNCLRSRKRGWDDGFDILIGCCESCLCVTEVTFFSNLLRNRHSLM